jgi:hypothetical protein
MTILAISGIPGIGKTALALHWAHQIAGHFLGGQLYVNLRGFHASAAPVTPTEAPLGFLDALEVPPARIPVGLNAQVSLYRSLIAGRQMLVLLDYASDSEHVRPLLPGSPDCVVLVTSRRALTSLAAIDGAHPLVLDVLTESDAVSSRPASSAPSG